MRISFILTLVQHNMILSLELKSFSKEKKTLKVIKGSGEFKLINIMVKWKIIFHSLAAIIIFHRWYASE